MTIQRQNELRVNIRSLTNVFDNVHVALRQEHNSNAVWKIIEKKTGKLQRRFRPYANHAWYLVGSFYLSKSRFDEAVSAFLKAIRNDGEDIDARLALGYCYSELGKHLKARNTLLKATAYSPKDPRIRYNLANAYFDLLKFEFAIEHYKVAVRSRDKEISLLAKKNLALARQKQKGK